MLNKDLQNRVLIQELDETTARALAYEKVLREVLDNYTIQSCCICYGGNSFPGPMKEALECFIQIINSRVDRLLTPEPA